MADRPNVPFTEQTLDVLGSTLHLYRGGSGPFLLVLHGEEGQHGWRRHHELLAEHATVLAPTMPGTGTSSYPDWLETVPQLAKFYLEMLDKLGVREVAILGSSLGGWVAAELASMCPERVTRLVLNGPMGIRPRSGEIEDLFLIIYREYMQRSFASLDAPAFTEIWRGAPSDNEEEEELKVREMTARFAYRPYMADLHLPPLLARIQAPALIVVGAEDRITPIDCANGYLEALPDARIVSIPNSGHFPQLEAPDRFAAPVLQFLAGQPVEEPANTVSAERS